MTIASQPSRSALIRLLYASCLAVSVTAPPVAASYAQHPEALHFVDEMAARHGFERGELQALFERARHDERAIRLITPPSQPGARSWRRYRSRFLTEDRIEGGITFLDMHGETLRAASERYGVPPEIIVSILGVETHYGSHTGNFETLSALATLAFDYPPRAPLFRRELENLLLLAREQGRDPFTYSGSYAGALGTPQFLPSSIRTYAVDFDSDGRIDLEASIADAIGSVANYLATHGWRSGEPVAIPVELPAALDPRPLIDAGIEPVLDSDSLAQQGIVSRHGPLPALPATLVDLASPGEATQYWLGFRNFYVITRYNRSSFYAMSVFELAEAIRSGSAHRTVRAHH